MILRTVKYLSLSLIVVGQLIVSNARASCIGWDKSRPDYDSHYYSISHEFHRAKFVIEARAIRETWLGEDGKAKPLKPPFQFGGARPWGFDPYMGVYYDVEVLKAFKGNPGARLRLFSENSTARFWLADGKAYLIFVTEEPFEQPIGRKLTIDNCGNSAALRTARSALRKVESLSATK